MLCGVVTTSGLYETHTTSHVSRTKCDDQLSLTAMRRPEPRPCTVRTGLSGVAAVRRCFECARQTVDQTWLVYLSSQGCAVGSGDKLCGYDERTRIQVQLLQGPLPKQACVTLKSTTTDRRVPTVPRPRAGTRKRRVTFCLGMGPKGPSFELIGTVSDWQARSAEMPESTTQVQSIVQVLFVTAYNVLMIRGVAT